MDHLKQAEEGTRAQAKARKPASSLLPLNFSTAQHLEKAHCKPAEIISEGKKYFGKLREVAIQFYSARVPFHP